jgi:CheY-like chemotaxis protein
MPSIVAAAPRPSILLVDDDAISREVLSMLLEMHGYPVACAEDGAQALARVEAEPPEVILMDTQMPGLSGLDLIRALRAATQARIIAISGSEPGESIRQAADGFLLKPIQPKDLDELLAAASASPVRSDAAPAGTNSETDSGTDPDTDPAGASAGPALDGPVIDPEVLGKLKAMMPPSAVREIYAAVAADLTTRLETLAAAMEAGNAAEVTRLAHTTKGGCSMVGLTAATEAAARLESSNRNGTWSKELAQLRAALAALQRILGDEFPV